ncbi:DivIVA domain-containing protein [Dethiothermospora halolimnae]|uniref:DivIVA domain-containing protein n=1 Tax=Dethiothermospora halolimnae TaxID=3114390 RepID=UPI003CCB8D4C
MITPLDIENKEFSTGIGGYKKGDVDGFLDEVIVDYEKIYKENKELKERVKMLKEQLEHYNDIEKTLQDTLVMAQNTADEVNASAKKKSQMIISEAEEKARRIIEGADNEVVKIKQEYENIRKDMMVFKTRFRTLLKSQLDSLEELCDLKEEEAI